LFAIVNSAASAGAEDRSDPAAASGETGVVRIGAVAYSPAVVTVFNDLRRYLNGHDFPSDYVLYSNYDALVAALQRGEIDIAWNTPLFTAPKAFDENRAKRFTELMTAMKPSDSCCADIMRLEGTKKWLPGHSEGFEDLIGALQRR